MGKADKILKFFNFITNLLKYSIIGKVYYPILTIMVCNVNRYDYLTNKGVLIMFTYQPLRDLMLERNISFRHLRDHAKIDSVAAVKLNRDDGYVSMHVLDKLCSYLSVSIDQIVAHVDDVAG